MADRQDIDALLIGALYGELSDGERERLEAHLVSHPQDRAALDDMRATRTLLRDSQLVTALGNAEPPPAVSAKLMQEAARRAPAPKAAAGGGVLGWLASALRPLLLHPAMSAAAALVIVVGVAGVMYANGKWKTTTKKEAPTASNSAMGPGAGSAAGSGSAVATLETEAQQGNYRVDLDDKTVSGDDSSSRHGEQQIAADNLRGNAGGHDDGDGKVDKDKGDEVADPFAGSHRAHEAPRKAEPAQGAAPLVAGKGKAADYIEIDKNGDEIGMRDYDGNKLGENGPAPAPTPTVGAAADQRNRNQAPASHLEGLGSGSAAPNFESTAQLDSGGSNFRLQLPPSAPSAPSGATTGAGTTAGAGGGAGSGAGQKIVTQKAPVALAKDTGKKTATDAYDPKADAALVAWARDQHARMVKLVNAGKCNDAGNVGADIARRAPEYYQANVANDRQVRACRAYVERARHAKSAEDAKSRAATPRAPAPDREDMANPTSN